MARPTEDIDTGKWYEFSRFEIAVITVWAVIAIIAIFVDLEISKAVANPDSSFGQFTATYGELPGFLLILFSLSVVLLSKPMNMYYTVIGLLVTYFVGFLAAARLTEGLIPQIILGFVLPAVVFLIVWQFVPFHHHYLLKAAERTVKVAIIVPAFLVTLIKLVWGRVRFRDLNADYSNYSPWFIPQGITGDRSFPSGHAAMGWMLVCLIYFIQDRTLRLIIGTITALWAVSVSWGRVVIGAHYLSDITFSTGFAILAINYYYEKQKLLLDEDMPDL